MTNESIPATVVVLIRSVWSVFITNCREAC